MGGKLNHVCKNGDVRFLPQSEQMSLKPFAVDDKTGGIRMMIMMMSQWLTVNES